MQREVVFHGGGGGLRPTHAGGGGRGAGRPARIYDTIFLTIHMKGGHQKGAGAEAFSWNP